MFGLQMSRPCEAHGALRVAAPVQSISPSAITCHTAIGCRLIFANELRHYINHSAVRCGALWPGLCGGVTVCSL